MIRENPAIRANLRIDSRESGHLSAQRAENGGLDPSWLIFAFSGRTDFPS